MAWYLTENSINQFQQARRCIYSWLPGFESLLDDLDAHMIKRENAVRPSLLPEESRTLICIEMNCRRPPRVCTCAICCAGVFVKRAMLCRPARITGDEVTPQSHQQPSDPGGGGGGEGSEPGCTYACYMFSVIPRGAAVLPTVIYGAHRNIRYVFFFCFFYFD